MVLRMGVPRIVVSHGASGRALAKELAERLADVEVALEGHARPGRTLAARMRRQIDACEILVVLGSAADARAAWAHQEIGYALARGARILLVGRVEVALALDAPTEGWPRTPRGVDALAERIRAALPATPRAAVRSLAHSSQERWSQAVREETARELRARGWEPLAIPGAWEGEHPVFVTRVPDLVWRKRVRGRWVYLRARVAPFNPVDLVSVRARFAPRVLEWWLLRTGRSDAWMQKLYRGDSEPLTARTRFFGVRGEPLAGARGAGVLIARRFLTERVDRTGEVAGELAALDAWVGRAFAPAPTPAACPTCPTRACRCAPGRRAL